MNRAARKTTVIRKTFRSRRRLAFESLESRLALAVGINGAATTRIHDVYSLQVDAPDPADSTIAGWVVDWGDSRVDTFATYQPTLLHSYAAPGSYQIKLALQTTSNATLPQSSLALLAFAATPDAGLVATQQGLLAEIFSTTRFVGSPSLVRVDPTIDFDFGTGGADPRLPARESFAVRWTGTLTPEQTANYKLFTNTGATDTVRLWVDDTLVIDTAAAPTINVQSARVSLVANQAVSIRIEYVAGVGRSQLSLRWENANGLKQAIPTSAFGQSSPPASVKGLLQERFFGVGGTNLGQFQRNSNYIANQPSAAARFAAPTLAIAPGDAATSPADEAGRFRGFIIAPETGSYQFALTGLATAQLRIGTNESASDLRVISRLDTPTTFNQHTAASVPVSMLAGQRYYVEVLYRYVGTPATNFLGVLWKKPSDIQTGFSAIPLTTLRSMVPQVSLRANISETNEAAGYARGASLAVERSDDLGRDLQVYYVTGGTATNGVDYRKLSGAITIPAGKRSAEIRVEPIDDNILEGPETVNVRLLSSVDYALGDESDQRATATIRGETITATPKGQPNVYAGNEVGLASRVTSGDATYTNVAISDTTVPFTSALRVDVNSYVNDYDVRVRWSNQTAIAKNDVLLASVYARIIQPTIAPGRISLRLEQQSPPNIGNQAFYDVTDQWQQFIFPFVAPVTFGIGKAQFDVRLGYSDQTIEFAGARLLNFKHTVTLNSLPRTVHSYGGRDTSSSWRSDAENDGYTNRNDPLILTFPGSKDGSLVTLHPIEPEYKIGTAASYKYIAPTAGPYSGTANGLRYQAILLNLFDRITDENAEQWSSWLDDPNRARQVAAWATSHGLTIHGHSVVWGHLDGFPTPDSVRARYQTILLSSGAAAAQFYLESAILANIQTGPLAALSGNIPGSNEPITPEWDVQNHPVLDQSLLQITGQDFLDHAINVARAMANPQTKFFLNEALTLSQEFGGLTEPFYNLVAGYLSRGLPIDGIGLQSHFYSDQLPSIESIRAKLDRFAALGLELESTELDVDSVFNDVQTQADFTRDFLLSMYAQPKSTATTFWGFWQGEHWRSDENAGLFANDWSVKPNGQVLLDTVSEKTTQYRTNGQGVIKATLPRGEYEVTIMGINGTTKTRVTINRGGTIATIHSPELRISQSQLIVTAGAVATNQIAVVNPGVGNVSLTSSIGTLTKLSDTGYRWTLTAASLSSPTSVTIIATDSNGSSFESRFQLIVTNAPAVIVRTKMNISRSTMTPLTVRDHAPAALLLSRYTANTTLNDNHDNR